MEKQTVLYRHSELKRDASGKAFPQTRVTIAAVVSNGKLHVGAVRCSAKDTYIKEEGRKDALDRAKSKPIMVVDVVDESNMRRQFSAVADGLALTIIRNPQWIGEHYSEWNKEHKKIKAEKKAQIEEAKRLVRKAYKEKYPRTFVKGKLETTPVEEILAVQQHN